MSEFGPIDGVGVKPLVRHPDDRGFFQEVLRADEGLLTRFGQLSMAFTYPGVIKAFHWHARQEDLWFFPAGEAQVVLYDRRPDSPSRGRTQVLYAGEHHPVLIRIPIGVAHGYRVLGNTPATIVYVTTEPYRADDPDEWRIPWDDPTIGFDWRTQFR